MTVVTKICMLIGLLLALLLGVRLIDQRGYDRAKAEDHVVFEKIKSDARATLLQEVERTRKAEQALQALKNTQELKDAQHQKIVASLSDRLRSLVGPAGRLRDPNADRCGSGGGSPQAEPPSAPSGRPDDPAEAGGLLSAQLSGLLQQLAREADDINVAYTSCRADAYAVRSASP